MLGSFLRQALEKQSEAQKVHIHEPFPGVKLIHVHNGDPTETLAEPDPTTLGDIFEHARAAIDSLYEGADFDPDDEIVGPVDLDAVPEAIDLSHEESRIYNVLSESGKIYELEVEHPVSLTIAADGSHEITTYERVGYIIPPGWLWITVTPNYGHSVFPGHDPVNEIDTGEDAGC